MDIYNYLKDDHTKVANLMERVISNGDAEERETMFEMIKHELTLHAETEEATFYKAIEEATRSRTTEEEIEHAHGEHDEIKDCLAKISATPVTSDIWLHYFTELKDIVTHHVEEEETEIFESAKKILDAKQARDLATQMDKLKQQKLEHLSAA